jgi:hypothetical protein
MAGEGLGFLNSSIKNKEAVSLQPLQLSLSIGVEWARMKAKTRGIVGRM